MREGERDVEKEKTLNERDFARSLELQPASGLPYDPKVSLIMVDGKV